MIPDNIVSRKFEVSSFILRREDAACDTKPSPVGPAVCDGEQAFSIDLYPRLDLIKDIPMPINYYIYLERTDGTQERGSSCRMAHLGSWK